MRRKAAHTLVAVAVIPFAATGSEETLIEETVVTASFTGVNSASAAPIHVIDGDEIAQSGAQSLGEHIDALLGVSTADFGAAVGQPIIRGMSGTRVRVLNNGTVVRDVSGLGPDHPIDSILSHIQQIEVVRGPSALLYSNGAIGGIVNIVDGAIPMTDLDGFSGSLGAESQSVNDGEALDFALRGNVGALNIMYSYQDTDMENYEIPDNAVLGGHDEGHGEDHDDDHGDEHDEDHGEEHGEEHGEMVTLANSDAESTSHRFGLSTTGDWGYVGVSYSDLSNTYGIPFHGDDDHGADEEGHDDDHEEEGHDEHEGERIFSNTESETLTLRGSFNTSLPFINAIDFVVRDSDYELMEQHAEEEHEGEDHDEEGHEGQGHAEGPTVFSNESTEVQVALDLSAGERIRRLVFNYAQEEMSIVGEEAFMAPVDSTETTLGFFTSDDFSFATLDFGARFDRVERDGSIAEKHHEDEHDDEHEDEHEGEHEDEHEEDMVFEPQSFKEDAFSVAASLSRDLNDYASVSLGLSSVSKVPSSQELFMNGEHLVTSRYELGDVTLDTERSDNIDLTFKFNTDFWYGTASVFHSQIDNYIYLRDELEEEHEDHMDGDHDDDEHEGEGHIEHGDLTLAEYKQQDAEFTGYEIEVGARFELPRGQLQLSLARDEVEAEFSNGQDVPRITPARNMFTARYTLDDFSVSVLVKDVEQQKNVALGESTTDGFTLVNANASWSYGLNDSTRLTLSAFARNLTDEIGRNHASFVKDQVPLPGRNMGVRLRFDF